MENSIKILVTLYKQGLKNRDDLLMDFANGYLAESKLDYSEKCEAYNHLKERLDTPAKLKETGIDLVNVRFFVYGENEENEVDILEVNESDFLEATGKIEYERHSVFANGCRQICLTKSNGYGG